MRTFNFVFVPFWVIIFSIQIIDGNRIMSISLQYLRSVFILCDGSYHYIGIAAITVSQSTAVHTSHPSPVVTVTRLFEGYLRGRPQFKPKPRWNDSNQRFQYDSRLYYSGFLTKNPIVLGSLSWKFWCPAEIAWIEPASGKWITRIIRCHSPLLSHNDTVLLR